jgi:hypothetical protein
MLCKCWGGGCCADVEERDVVLCYDASVAVMLFMTK